MSIDPAFLQHHRHHEGHRQGTQSPLSPIPTLVSANVSEFDKSDAVAEQSRFTKHYADAFTDTYGVVGGAPFIYKTGPAWPKRTGGPQPSVREMRPVAHSHPIATHWIDIVGKVEGYFKEHEIDLTIVAGLAFANAKEKTAFCELVVVIGIPPRTFEFADVKAAADDVERTILAQCGFPNVPIAVREWEVIKESGAGPELPSLDPLIDRDITEYRHLFSSNPGLAIRGRKEGVLGGHRRGLLGPQP